MLLSRGAPREVTAGQTKFVGRRVRMFTCRLCQGFVISRAKGVKG